MSELVRNVLLELHQRAAFSGIGNEFVAAYRQIVDRLQREPFDFGEPLYRLPALELQVRQGVVSPLLVDYAVHEQRPMVFIRGFRMFDK